jgi:nicotinamidase-related amidase
MSLPADETTLIFIDLQNRLMPSIFRGEEVLDKCVRIAKIAQLLNVPIVGTEQSPQSLGNSVAEITPYYQSTFIKEHFDGCQDGLIDQSHKDAGHLILAGCEAHVCVMQTALSLIKRGYQITILIDAIGSRKALDKEVAIQRLIAAGATPSTVEMLAFEWLGSPQNPHFKNVLEVIKS